MAMWVKRLDPSRLPKDLRDTLIAAEHLRLEPARTFALSLRLPLDIT